MFFVIPVYVKRIFYTSLKHFKYYDDCTFFFSRKLVQKSNYPKPIVVDDGNYLSAPGGNEPATT